MYLKRSIYSKFLEWKNEKSKKVLLVEGARQVGKTYLSKKFAYENFENVIYINLLEDSGLRLLSCYDDIQKNIKEGHNMKKKIYRNMMLVAFIVGVALQLFVVEVPGVRDVFNTAGDKMNWTHWLITMAMSLLPLIVHEIVILVKFIIKKTKHNKED